MSPVHASVGALLLAATLSGLTGCGTSAPEGSGGSSRGGAPVAMPRPDAVVADVGIGFVTTEEFATAAGSTPGADPSMPLEARKEVLDQLLTDEVLLQEALRQGLVRDPKVRKVLVNLLLRQEVYDKVSRQDFTDEELRVYYDAHRDEFMVPEKIQIKRILVKFADGERTADEARAIIDEARKSVVKDPESFRVVAEKVSEDAHQRRGGDLGFVPRSGKPGIDPKVAEVAFDLKMGKVSEPFEADGGYNIVMPVNKREAVERTFSQMRGSVLRKLRSERFQELTDRYIDGLRGAAETTIDETVLMGVEIRERPTLPGRGGPGDLDDHDHGDEDADHEHGPGRPHIPGGPVRRKGPGTP